MRQTVIFNNQTYIFLDYINLGTSIYLFIFNESSKDLRCVKENNLEEYSINSSFLPCQLNKIKIISTFLNKITPLIKTTTNPDIISLTRSIKKFAFYIKESDLKLYLNDNVPYQITENSLSNLNLFLSKTIEVNNQLINPFYIKSLDTIENRPLSFNNQIFVNFHTLDINGLIYILAYEQNQTSFIVFNKFNNTYNIPSIDINNPTITKNLLYSNILIGYFINVLNEKLNQNKIDFDLVNASIEKFKKYIENTNIKNSLVDNGAVLQSEEIIKLLIYLDENIKIYEETIDPFSKVQPEIIVQNDDLTAPPVAKPEMTYFEKEGKKKKFNTYTFILIFSVLVCIAGIIMLVNWLFEGDKNDKINDKIKDDVEINEESDGEAVNPPAEEPPESDYWRYMKMSLIDVDFDSLLKTNPDTVGWIQVNGTNINYPIVQSGDNDYYLHHAFDGSYNNAGWIFADYRIKLNDLSPNNVLYGHGRLDTTMFGSLKNILTNDWLNNSDNYVIKLSTPTENTLWQVYSVYHIPAESYYITTDFPTTNQFETFLNKTKNRSQFDFKTTLNTNDKILTLSTCQDNYNNRVVMHAKLIKSKKR